MGPEDADPASAGTAIAQVQPAMRITIVQAAETVNAVVAAKATTTVRARKASLPAATRVRAKTRTSTLEPAVTSMEAAGADAVAAVTQATRLAELAATDGIERERIEHCRCGRQ
jgi:hypothetical protein